MPPLLNCEILASRSAGRRFWTGRSCRFPPATGSPSSGATDLAKSTLFRIAAGQITADRGSRFVQPSARLAYLPQEPDMSGFATTLDYVPCRA